MDGTGAPSDDGFDLGPAWIWPRVQPALAALVRELDLPTFGQTSAGDVVFERMSREPAQRYAGPAQEPQSMRLAGGTAAGGVGGNGSASATTTTATRVIAVVPTDPILWSRFIPADSM